MEAAARWRLDGGYWWQLWGGLTVTSLVRQQMTANGSGIITSEKVPQPFSFCNSNNSLFPLLTSARRTLGRRWCHFSLLKAFLSVLLLFLVLVPFLQLLRSLPPPVICLFIFVIVCLSNRGSLPAKTLLPLLWQMWFFNQEKEPVVWTCRALWRSPSKRIH